MRTTLTLDPDVEQIIRERTATGVSFKQAVNDAIRDGGRRQAGYTFSTPVFHGRYLIDVTHANQLAADLEDQALAEKVAGQP